MKFSKGKSGNPGGRPKVLAEVQQLARCHAPEAIDELRRLALKAKSETARVSAIRELLDRGFGRSRQNMEINTAPDNPVRLLLDLIDERGKIGDRERPTFHIPSRASLVENPLAAQITEKSNG